MPVGEAWFDVCAEGSRAEKAGPGDGLKHSDYSASLAEALYGSIAQALSFLCAVAPEVCRLSSDLPCKLPSDSNQCIHSTVSKF